jgi:hypothetical protein
MKVSSKRLEGSTPKEEAPKLRIHEQMGEKIKQ